MYGGFLLKELLPRKRDLLSQTMLLRSSHPFFVIP
jgi:hypothetical protein